jgi:hypothetical protein
MLQTLSEAEIILFVILNCAMQKRIRILLVVLFISFFYTGGLHAQVTTSPYSMFGLGIPEEQSTGYSKSMGGTGIGFMSDQYINMQNPASYSGLDSLLTIFEIGVFGKYTNYSTSQESQALVNANLKYITMGFRVTPWLATSFGFSPYSSVGYDINAKSPLGGSILTYDKTYSGEGGVNQIYLGGSVKVFKNLSVGVNASYLFGNITHSEASTSLSYTLKDVTYVSNLNFKYGLNYHFDIKKSNFCIGLIYTNAKTLNTDNVTTVTTDYSTTNLKGRTHNYRIPEDFGAGLSFRKGFFHAGVDFERSMWQGISFSNPLVQARNSDRISFGVEFPSLGLNKGTTRMILYRFGAEYKGSPYVIQGVPVNYYGMTFGAGLPLKGVVSVLNLSLELGQNGTTSKELFKETFVSLHLDFALRALWFVKNKYE